ncbi:hypothetical protein [Pedobacter metabolipauper]|uniref:DUF4369 domain-containing protein n=1 Tax=Pedobacter metabolipauper TaxID=425513 RepID=A0A4R6SUZ5_9SPHI|nr:hypothetical protein [Pedobacter metabolipauper]TDQ09658.1 hypothetical protein ATK78_1814 [Pedobacter metabolipauper]
MRSIKAYLFFGLFFIAALAANAQDIIVISEGNFIRGTIQGTDFSNVALKNEDETISLYKAKDIKEFVWNGQTYVSKPVLVKKKMELRFFKLIEQGTVNLYAFGGATGVEEVQPKRARIRPSIGIGGGSGGFGGVGVGGGITFGGNRNGSAEPVKRVVPETYFIEKFGTGPMLEIPADGGNSAGKNQQIKSILLQKLNNDEDLAERINATETFDAKLVRAFVSAYNAMKK